SRPGRRPIPRPTSPVLTPTSWVRSATPPRTWWCSWTAPRRSSPAAGRPSSSARAPCAAGWPRWRWWRCSARRWPACWTSRRAGGLAAGLLGPGVASALLAADNAVALVLVLPAAHLWLVLPSAARLGRRFMIIIYLLGMLGPAALVFEYATRFHLGLSTPRAM